MKERTMNEKLKTNLIAAGVTVTLIGSVLVWGYNQFTARAESAPKTPEIVTQAAKPKFDELSPEGRAIETLKAYHEQFNTWVGYGNDKEFSRAPTWDSAIKSDALNPESYRQLAEALAGIQGAQIDLYHVVKLATIAREKRDVQALIYMHRILHDLDVNYFNKLPGSDYWGVTETIRHTSEAETVVPDTRADVEKYIEKNI